MDREFSDFGLRKIYSPVTFRRRIITSGSRLIGTACVYVNSGKVKRFVDYTFTNYVCYFAMTDSNFDNGFEKLPAAGEFLAGASAGGLHVEELRGPAMSSEATAKESSQTKSSCKLSKATVFERLDWD